MKTPVWGMLVVFATTLAVPLTANAASAVPYSLPQDIEYDDYVAAQINRAEFSTDVKHLLEIKQAAGAEEDQTRNNNANITAFIYNNEECAAVNDTQKYRVIIRNIGSESARSVSIQNQYPEFTSLLSYAPDAQHDEEQRLIIWTIPELSPGSYSSFEFETKIEQRASGYLDNLTVYYKGKGKNGKIKTTIGEQNIAGNCGVKDTIRSFIAGRALPAQPAILCDPSQSRPSGAPIYSPGTLPAGHPAYDEMCEDTYNILNLGPKYKEALAPKKQPTVCSVHDLETRRGWWWGTVPGSSWRELQDPLPGCKDNKPQLGPRFAEAIADINPGECRSLEENRIMLQDFNSALGRRSKPSALYLSPIQGIGPGESGNDYRYLIHDNLLRGIEHLDNIRDVLLPIHLNGINELTSIVKGMLKTYVTQDKNEFTTVKDDLVADINDEMPNFLAGYISMQIDRTDAFEQTICGGAEPDDTACKLTQNVKTAISEACVLPQNRYDPPGKPAPSPGGWENWFKPNVVTVSTAYNDMLNFREAEYPNAQTRSMARYTQLMDDLEREFMDIADLYLTNESEARKQMLAFLQKLERDRVQFFANEIMEEYREHLLKDNQLDDDIRVGMYEDKISIAREEATGCQKEKLKIDGGFGYIYNIIKYPSPGASGEADFKPYIEVAGSTVEVTYCENGPYYFRANQTTTGAEKVQHDTEPVEIPDYVIPQAAVPINHNLTLGQSCGGRPGDPWWASDCSCDCGQVVAVPTGGPTPYIDPAIPSLGLRRLEGQLQFCSVGSGYYTNFPWLNIHPEGGVFYPPPGWSPLPIPEPYYRGGPVYGKIQEQLNEWRYSLTKITKPYETKLWEAKNAANQKYNDLVKKSLKEKFSLKNFIGRPAEASAICPKSELWSDGCCYNPGTGQYDLISGECFEQCYDDVDNKCDFYNTPQPTGAPTGGPASDGPSTNPSNPPDSSIVPSVNPSDVPNPSEAPSGGPPNNPSVDPSAPPASSIVPSVNPSDVPNPSEAPSGGPPSSDGPSGGPPSSDGPSADPSAPPASSIVPSVNPSDAPNPSEAPSGGPPASDAPSSDGPSGGPPASDAPSSDGPSGGPPSSDGPSGGPPSSDGPSANPSDPPVSSIVPSVNPSDVPNPSEAPSGGPPASDSPPSDGPPSDGPPSPDTPSGDPSKPPVSSIVPSVNPSDAPNPSEAPSGGPPASDAPSSDGPSDGPPSPDTPSGDPSKPPASSIVPSVNPSDVPNPSEAPSGGPPSDGPPSPDAPSGGPPSDGPPSPDAPSGGPPSDGPPSDGPPSPDTPSGDPSKPPVSSIVPSVNPSDAPNPSEAPSGGPPASDSPPSDDPPSDGPPSPDTPSGEPSDVPSPTIVPSIKPSWPPNPSTHASPSVSPKSSPSPSVSPKSSPSPSPSASWCPSPKPKKSPPKSSPKSSPSSSQPSPKTSPASAAPSPSPASPSPSDGPGSRKRLISVSDIWVTSKEECLGKGQICHHFNERGLYSRVSCFQGGPKDPSPSPSPSASATASQAPPSKPPSKEPSKPPSKEPSKPPSKEPSKPPPTPRICINPDGTIVSY